MTKEILKSREATISYVFDLGYNTDEFSNYTAMAQKAARYHVDYADDVPDCTVERNGVCVRRRPYCYEVWAA